MSSQIIAPSSPVLSSARQLHWPKAFRFDTLDAAENISFLRDLEFISKQQLQTEYAVLKGRQMVPTHNEGIPIGDQSFTYRMWDYTGKAKAIADGADDLPMVNEKGVEASQRMQEYGVAYGYSIGEVQAAADSRSPRPLESDRAMVAKRVLDQKLDDLVFNGDTDRSLVGFNGLTGTNTFTPLTKGVGGTAWLDNTGKLVATADEVLADLNGMVRQIVNSTKEVERPTRILLPTAQMLAITQTARSSVSDTTIAKFFTANNPGIELMSWERLAGAGAAAADRAIAYEPNVMKVKLLMPLEFAALAPQQRNFKFVINNWMKTGGVISPYPLSICFTDGI